MAHAARQAGVAPGATSPIGRLRAAASWSGANRLKVAVIGTLAVAVVAAHVTLYRLLVARGETQSPEPLPSLDDALESLAAGRYAEARAIARRLDARTEISLSEPGKFHAICGLSAAREADEAILPEERRRLFAVATQHLSEAREFELPPDRRGEVLIWLGKSLLASGREVEARNLLQTALAVNPADARGIHALLATAYAYGESPDDRAALSHLDHFLAGSKLEGDAAFDMTIERSRLLVRLGRTDEARKMLDTIPARAAQRPAAEVILGRALMRDAQAAGAGRDKLDEAIKTLREAQARDATDRRVVRQAMYLIGVCQERLGQSREALDQFDRTQRQFHELAEGFAACVAQANLHYTLAEFPEAIAAWQRAAASPGRLPEPGEEVWVSDRQFTSAVVETLRRFTAAKKFEHALALSDVLEVAGKREEALELAAEARTLWAREILRDAEAHGTEGAEAQRRKARDLLRTAGRDYVELAKMRFITHDYTKHVAQAAASFLAGGDYDKAVEQFGEYLEYESGPAVPKALVELGEAELSRGNPEAALRALEKCVELYPGDPSVYRGRLLAGKAYEERGDRSRAIELLEENLSGRLTPASPEWRDAIFAEGRILYNEAVHRESESRALDAKGPQHEAAATKALEAAVEVFHRAIARLSEAVQRYPNDPQALASRYMIAEAYRYAARLPQRQLRKISVHQQQALLNRDVQKSLEAALEHYNELQSQLNRLQESSPLSTLNATMLRNCYFAIGSILFELGQNDRALEAYRAAANAYQNVPEAMNAYFQMAACHRRRNHREEARVTLEQARVVLSRITADDAAFVAATSHTRQEWEKLLAWMARM
jgi:tetratricopeptide (TPR) repeat protein